MIRFEYIKEYLEDTNTFDSFAFLYSSRLTSSYDFLVQAGVNSAFLECPTTATNLADDLEEFLSKTLNNQPLSPQATINQTPTGGAEIIVKHGSSSCVVTIETDTIHLLRQTHSGKKKKDLFQQKAFESSTYQCLEDGSVANRHITKEEITYCHPKLQEHNTTTLTIVDITENQDERIQFCPIRIKHPSIGISADDYQTIIKKLTTLDPLRPTLESLLTQLTQNQTVANKIQIESGESFAHRLMYENK